MVPFSKNEGVLLKDLRWRAQPVVFVLGEPSTAFCSVRSPQVPPGGLALVVGAA